MHFIHLKYILRKKTFISRPFMIIVDDNPERVMLTELAINHENKCETKSLYIIHLSFIPYIAATQIS